MTTIRPDAFPQVPLRPQPQNGSKMEAQRAFFAAIAGKSQTAASQPQPAPAAPATEPAVRTAASSAEPPQKILRPGSILDIRV